MKIANYLGDTLKLYYALIPIYLTFTSNIFMRVDWPTDKMSKQCN